MPVAAQPARIHQDVALGVAIISVQPDHAQALFGVAARQWQVITELQTQAPRQLFTEHRPASIGQLRPGIGALFQ
ncbi:hypothetical protein D3C76_1377710 [compost metagenome]